jgi:uridine kinase
VTARLPSVDATAADLAAVVLRSPPTLGSGRLVCVDGPAGSGKTTLAAALNRSFRDALRGVGSPASRVRIVHMDSVYDGWAGLGAGMDTVASSVVRPLRAGLPGSYRRYDWHRSAYAEERVVTPCDVLLVEGVGSGGRLDGYADAVTCLVWVATPPDVRLDRGLQRDGERQRQDWLAWQRQEADMFVRERIRERADVVVDGTTGRVVDPGD